MGSINNQAMIFISNTVGSVTVLHCRQSFRESMRVLKCSNGQAYLALKPYFEATHIFNSFSQILR